MQCYPGPDPKDQSNPPLPYPDQSVVGSEVRFENDLVLFRAKEDLIGRDGGDDVYLVGAPKTVEWKGQGGQCGRITVPLAFITDLTSVPRPMRWLISRAGPWLEAAVVHDYLYVAWDTVERGVARERDRKFADDIMLAAMLAAEVPRWQARVIYFAVRTFGRIGYAAREECYFGNQRDPRLRYLEGVNDVVQSDA